MSQLHLLGADDLARQAIDALREKRMADAVAFTLAFSSTYGNIHPRAHALCAHVLTQSGNTKAALDYWDKAVNQCPERMEWVEQALRTAWAVNDTDRAKHYVAILQHMFCTHPSPAFFDELAQHGHALTGACGIHAGYFRAWFLLSQGKKFFISSDPATPRLRPGALKKYSAGAYTLCELDVPLTAHHSPYCIHLIVDGRHVNGSPVYCSPCEAARPKKKTANNRRSAQHAVTIVVPCYDGYAETLSCLGTVFASLRRNITKSNILAVWDHGPDPRLHAALKRLSLRHKISLLSTPSNMGFLGSVNHALAHVAEGNVILLNADTLVHGDWIDRMQRVAQQPDAATVTAMGSEAELLSFPAYYDRGDVRTLHEAALLDNACRALPQEMQVREIPVGMGFCMLLTRRALDLCDGLDGLMLFRGYGEESDFCLRAVDRKLKNYAACNVYVAHLGGRSFGASKRAYVAQNNKAIFKRFPRYDADYSAFLLEDPLKVVRDHISRHACQPGDGSLHVYPWAVRDAAPQDTKHSLKAQQAACFVLPCGAVTKVLVRISQAVALADMQFLLPKDAAALRTFVLQCGVTNLIVHGDFRWISRLEQILNIPTYGARQGKITPSFDVGDVKATYIVIPPLTLHGWKHFCTYAYRHLKARFWVQHLKQLWRFAPRPENVCPLPDVCDVRPLQPTALLFAEQQEVENLTAWRTWLDDHGAADIPMGCIPAEAA